MTIPSSGGTSSNEVVQSFPSSQTTWTVQFNNRGLSGSSYSVYAVCLPVTPTG